MGYNVTVNYNASFNSFDPSAFQPEFTSKMSRPPTKRARLEITAGRKKELCLYKEAHPKAIQDDIQRHFSVEWGITIGRSTVFDILKQKDKWLSTSDVATQSTRTRGHKEPELEAALLMWFNDVQSRDVPSQWRNDYKKGKEVWGRTWRGKLFLLEWVVGPFQETMWHFTTCHSRGVSECQYK